MMHSALTLLLAVSFPQGQQFDSDTTVSVQQGSRLRVHNQGGDIIVKTWDRNQLRVQASHSARTEIAIQTRGAVVELEAHGRRGFTQALVDYQLTVPTWMALDLDGMYAEISVDGIRAPVKANTLEGNIVIKGGSETVTLSTVNGRIEVSGARGRLELNAVSNGIRVSDVQGDITAETVSGDIDLRRIDAKTVDAQTVSGEVIYEGRVVDGGSYSLLSHSGDVVFAIPEGSNATINTASASGEVESSFPLQTERSGRRRQVYRLGSGSATVDLETFSGDIRIVRPSSVPSVRSNDDDDHGVRVRVKPRIRVRPPTDRDDDDHEEDNQ